MGRSRGDAIDRSINRALWRIAQPRLRRLAAEVPPVSVEKFAADHGVRLPDWVDPETRAVEVRFAAIGLRRRGYAAFFERVGRSHYRARKHIVLSLALRAEPCELRVKTFLHELAHIIAGPGENHGPRWRDLAQALGIANPSARGGTLAVPLGRGDTSAYDRADLSGEPELKQGELFGRAAK